jgi:hypothetical protein
VVPFNSVEMVPVKPTARCKVQARTKSVRRKGEQKLAHRPRQQTDVSGHFYTPTVYTPCTPSEQARTAAGLSQTGTVLINSLHIAFSAGDDICYVHEQIKRCYVITSRGNLRRCC